MPVAGGTSAPGTDDYGMVTGIKGHRPRKNPTAAATTAAIGPTTTSASDNEVLQRPALSDGQRATRQESMHTVEFPALLDDGFCAAGGYDAGGVGRNSSKPL